MSVTLVSDIRFRCAVCGEASAPLRSGTVGERALSDPVGRGVLAFPGAPSSMSSSFVSFPRRRPRAQADAEKTNSRDAARQPDTQASPM